MTYRLNHSGNFRDCKPLRQRVRELRIGGGLVAVAKAMGSNLTVEAEQ